MNFVFGGFELDPERYELRGPDGNTVQVEPKVLELLTYLIRHRDRVVSKNELLEEIWEGRFVSESALTRCIYQARLALREETPARETIKTVIGRGYRFVAEVQVQAGPESDSTTERPPAPAGEAERPAQAPRETPAWLGRLSLTALAVLILALGFWIASKRPSETAQRAADEPAVAGTVELALLPISVPAERPDLGLLALSMTDLLWARLASTPEILVRSPDSSAEAVSAAGGLAAFAARSPVALIIRGSLEQSSAGSKAILRMSLSELGPEGRLREAPLGGSYELPLPDEELDLADFARVRDAVADNLVQRLEPTLALGQQEVPDPEAYQLYLGARQRLQDRHCDGGVSLAMIEQSIDIDPEFPLTWYLLASASYSQVWACGADASHFQRALEAARRARQLAPDLLEAQLIEATILVETGAIEESYELLRGLAESHPERAELRFEPAYPLRYAGYLGPAEALVREGLRMDPLYISTASTGMTPNVFLYRNDFDEFLKYLPDSGSAYHLFYRGLVEHLRGNETGAREALEPAFRENPGAVFGRLAHTLLNLLDGDLDTARAIVKQVARQRRDLGAVDGEITYKQAQMLALAGDQAAALEELALAVEQGFFCWPYFETDPALSSLRGEAGYQRILATAQERHMRFGRRFGLESELAASVVP